MGEDAAIPTNWKLCDIAARPTYLFPGGRAGVLIDTAVV
jgi:hypothetical protein